MLRILLSNSELEVMITFEIFGMEEDISDQIESRNSSFRI
jgi:hypothetical protein